MPTYHVPDWDGYFDRWSQLHGGYDPRRGFWPRTWLGLTYYCAAPLARRGVSPDAITWFGALVSGLVPVLAWLGGRWALAAVLVVVVSGLVDNLDGAVAAMTGRATPLGYLLDSVVDRISDGCYLLALWLLGAPAWLCIIGGVVTMLQEYVRARAGNAGMGELRVVTVAERPTRVIVAAFALCGAGVLPPQAAVAAGAGAVAWVATGAIGLVQLAVVVRRVLRPR